MEITLYNDDCFNILPSLEDHSVDMICCDLPYGTTSCSWDSILPFDRLWKEYERLIKGNGAIVLFSQQPFTTELIHSNIKLYKYNWIWEKDNATNFLNSHFQPMKVTEDICVFGNGNVRYIPQMRKGFKPYTSKAGNQKSGTAVVSHDYVPTKEHVTISNGDRYPINIIKFNRDKEKVHPTQKPVALLEYLINTYTNRDELVLDNCMGSGTCGLACQNTGRNFIGIEKDSGYFEIAKNRLDNNALLNSSKKENTGLF